MYHIIISVRYTNSQFSKDYAIEYLIFQSSYKVEYHLNDSERKQIQLAVLKD